MADILIAHLEKKSEEHGALKTLKSQWDFDSKLIPKALQTVGNLFPHYSRHDESHSRQLLVNIERLLGSSISRLTATDTWLILEAAYWHDIGMVVPKQDLIKELQSEGFQDFLAGIKQSPQHDLFRFASAFDTSNLAKCFLGADTPADAVGRFNEMMAEWFRQKHPARSEAIVRDPWSSAGISSPRTELIPARLFRVLGRICQMHGAPFEDLLAAGGLPYREAGMANEDAHPRFVACLLRMGDLLDLDDNRFCPVLQNIAGIDRPATSRAHEDKHRAIRHLRIDRDRIEVSAECETIPGYLEAYRWFDWLKQETQNQLSHWQEIAPSRQLGLLPTLGDLTVTLSGDLRVLRKGERPQFGVDEKSVISLLQGSNLYNGAFPCIRELLQNAVDATLLSTWVRRSPSDQDEQWKSPSTCTDLQRAQPVRFELIESADAVGDKIMTGKAEWLLRITDVGTGISSADLLHLLRIGGSQKNGARQRLIRGMPEWMKPSGAFGIGLQSAFLLTDCIRIRTKSIFSNETLELEMHSPMGPNEGLVLVRHLSNDVAQPFGTIVDIRFTLDRFARRWSFQSMGNSESLANRMLDSMDPVLDDSFHFDAGKIVDEVMAFGKKSPIPVLCEFQPIEGESVSLFSRPDEDNDWLYLPDVHGHHVEIRYCPQADRFAGSQSRFLYRGQKFKCDAIGLPHVAFEINLLSGAAGTWLSANRDQLVPKAANELIEVVLAALAQAVERDLKLIREKQGDRPALWPFMSLFLHVMSTSVDDSWKRLAAETDDAWKDVPVYGSSIRQCFEESEWLFGDQSKVMTDSLSRPYVSIEEDHGSALDTLALLAWRKEKGGSVQVLSTEDLGPQRISDAEERSQSTAGARHQVEVKRAKPILLFSRSQLPTYSDAALAEHLAYAANSFGNTRYLLDTQDERWQRLALRKDVELQAGHLIRPCARGPSTMLLPYLFSNGKVQVTASQLGRLSERVRPLLMEAMSVDEVKSLYEAFVRYVDSDLMHASSHAASWRAARGP